MSLVAAHPGDARPDDIHGPSATADSRRTVDYRQLPNSGSAFCAKADVATATAHAHGSLDLHTVDLLLGTIGVLLHAGQYRVTVDLADVSTIDAAGVKLLVAMQHSLAVHSGELTVINAGPPVLDALQRGPVAPRPSSSEQGSRDAMSTAAAPPTPLMLLMADAGVAGQGRAVHGFSLAVESGPAGGGVAGPHRFEVS